jgi:hypothetical protein
MPFLSHHYSQLKKRLELKYTKQFKTILKPFEKIDSPLAVWLQQNEDLLLTYSPVKWHFLQQVKVFQFLAEQPLDLGRINFGESEERVFETWNKSDFADYFLKELNRGTRLGEASRKTLKKLEKHLITMAKRHIALENKTSSFYRAQESLGEIVHKNQIIRLIPSTLHHHQKSIRLFNRSENERKKFSVKIQKALSMIELFSPTSLTRFNSFTEVIIPIKQKQFVSFSHQDLPGTSMINLYNRDFIDLLDDLIHENGHHHLNYYLNLKNLIREPLDNIFYSPWRRTLRPLRGIYHAFFTFFWALKLFSDIGRDLDLPHARKLFSASEKEKILWRAVEEFHMLLYSYQDLLWAYHQGLISESGWSLIKKQHEEIIKLRKLVLKWEKKLKNHTNDLANLKLALINAQRERSKLLLHGISGH